MVGAKDGQWSSRAGFLLTAIGFSVGLGNIWRFPYVMGENGGAAFLIIYLGCAFLIAFPLLICELGIGRSGGGGPVTSILNIAKKSGAHRYWGIVGNLAILGVFLIMSYYTVIAGWTFDYSILSITGQFKNISSDEAVSLFSNLTNDPLRLLFWHSLVNVLVVLVLRRNVQNGLEKVAQI